MCIRDRRTAASQAPIQTGIGLTHGELISGPIGSKDRMDFTVIGDPVNLASRIESMTKLYGADILICEQTMKRLTEATKMRRIDVVRVRGQTRPTNLYEAVSYTHLLRGLELHQEPPGRPWPRLGAGVDRHAARQARERALRG